MKALHLLSAFLLFLIHSTDGEDVLIVGNNYCFTNGDNPIIFNGNMDKSGTYSEVSRFFPPSDSDDFDNNFEPNDAHRTDPWTKNDWNIQRSLDADNAEIITDRRWEGFPITKMKDTWGNERNVSTNNIPLSFRAKYDTHISLRFNLFSYYEIILGQDNGTKSYILMTGKESDSSIVKYTNPLSESEWRHFLIQINDKSIKVIHNGETYLEFNGENDLKPPMKMFIRSNSTGLYKLHDYGFLESKKTHNSFDVFGPTISLKKKDILCISMFIKTDRSCELDIKIKAKGSDPVIDRPINTLGSWKKYDFKSEGPVSIGSYAIFLKKNSSSFECYWAVDDVRICKENEYRYIRTNDNNAVCQEVTSNGAKTLDLSKGEISRKDVDCPLHTFGTDCLPCSIFGSKFCSKFKYCQSNTKACYCTAGYYGNRCLDECPNSFFGHGCRKKGHCSSINATTGECYSQCYDPYKAPSCSEVKGPFFTNPPILLEVHPTSFVIQQSNRDMEGHGSYYYFRYSKGENYNRVTWVNINNYIQLIDSTPVTVPEAEADTTYRVQAIILDYNSQVVDFERQILKFQTSCIKFSEADITIEPSNCSAVVKFSNSAESCKWKRYYYRLSGTPDPKAIDRGELSLENLKPWTNYTFTLRYTDSDLFSKKFQTLEGKPSTVRSLDYTSGSDFIYLTWKEPNEKNGDISYEVQYRLVQHRGCEEKENNTFKSERTSRTEFNLKKLTPYSQYQVRIAARTNNFEGDYISTFYNTSALTEIPTKEKLKIRRIDSETDTAVIRLIKQECTDYSGPLHVQYKIVCLSSWCNRTTITYGPSERSFFLKGNRIKKLIPFSEYEVNVLISRPNQHYIDSYSTTFHTKPHIPHAIKELTVYSKNQTSISLRWRPPFPPTGILVGYMFLYSHSKERTPMETWVNDTNTQCTFWKEFRCFTISTDANLGETFINVKAKNKEVDTLGEVSETLRVSRDPEAPWRPENLTHEWTYENYENELMVRWYHPVNTNGQLEGFEITVREEEAYFYRTRSEEDYRLTYEQPLKLNESNSCSKFELCVRARNSFGDSVPICIYVNSPPLSSRNISEEDLLFHFDNSTITVNISTKDTVEEVYIFYSRDRNSTDIPAFERYLTKKENYLTKNESLKRSTLVYGKKNVNAPITFTIGDPNNTVNNRPNPQLSFGKGYVLSIIFVNKCNGFVRLRTFSKFITLGKPDEDETMKDGQGGENYALWALVLLLFIPVIVFTIWFTRRKNLHLVNIISRSKSPKEDEMVLTDKPRTNNVRVNIVKPKPVVVLQALKTKHSKKVPVTEFVKYVKEAIETGELEHQHNLFPRGLLKPHNIGAMPENKPKNRYKNLIAYDHTLVKLKDDYKEDYFEYINANYIDGYRKPRAYIATQGPKPNTLDDFWKMIWQENVKDILMLANVFENGKKKVEKYWPDINEEKTFGDIKVQYVSEQVFANFVLRVFDVSCDNIERKVTQMHYTTWPDHGVPMYSQSLVPFLQRLLKIPHSMQTPILIHCSAGVGRTGTIILSDLCLRMAAVEGSIDFLAHLENLRNQRATMVDNIEQYKLAHLVVLECLFGMRTAIPCTNDMPTIVGSTINNNGIKTQMTYILDSQWQDSAMETMLERDEQPLIYPEKNRVADIVPENYQVFLTRYPEDDEKSSYINAVYVNDFNIPGRYIVTQQPLPNTLGDFWRLVYETSSSVIISLNTVELSDKSICQVWPEKEEEFNLFDFMRIVHKKTKRLNFYSVITVLMEIKGHNLSAFLEGSTEVNIITFNDWKPTDLLPNSIEEFLAFRNAADCLSRTSERVIVMCYDGAKASGLYLAMSFLIEEMKLEQECDVCLAVRSIRHSRKQFVTSEEQYEFLYRAAVTFISGFQPYSNFA